MQNITRLFDFPYYQLEKYNLEKSLVTKYGEEWIATSTQEYVDKVNTISRALLRMGIKGLSVISRNTQGVKLIGVDSREKVIGAVRIAEKEG